jgi:DHA2 family multidrug resistance protein
MEQPSSLIEYGSRRVIVTITAVVCALLQIIDSTIVNVALRRCAEVLALRLTK